MTLLNVVLAVVLVVVVVGLVLLRRYLKRQSDAADGFDGVNTRTADAGDVVIDIEADGSPKQR